MDIDELRRIVTDFRDERDWKKFHNPKDLAISIAIESMELLEHFQWKSVEEVYEVVESRVDSIRDEIADIAIYLLSLVDILDIDLSEAIVEKVKKNAEKYPVEKSKGRADKYTEL
jgi:NTP pyrophosphatase (non-canonical NTP hydrolase)